MMIERRRDDDRMTKEVTKLENARNLKKNPSENDITISDVDEGLLSANHSNNNCAFHIL